MWEILETQKETIVAIDKCKACGAPMYNVMQHQSVCPKRKKEILPKRETTPKKADVPIVKPGEFHAGGRPRQHETCGLCGRPHYAKGLCSAHYRREKREGKTRGDAKTRAAE